MYKKSAFIRFTQFLYRLTDISKSAFERNPVIHPIDDAFSQATDFLFLVVLFQIGTSLNLDDHPRLVTFDQPSQTNLSFSWSLANSGKLLIFKRSSKTAKRLSLKSTVGYSPLSSAW